EPPPKRPPRVTEHVDSPAPVALGVRGRPNPDEPHAVVNLRLPGLARCESRLREAVVAEARRDDRDRVALRHQLAAEVVVTRRLLGRRRGVVVQDPDVHGVTASTPPLRSARSAASSTQTT